MKLFHINLTVPDVGATRAFLETYFEMTCIGSRGTGFAVLSDDDNFVLTLMKGKEVQYPGTFHIGFHMQNEEEVNGMNERLKGAGYKVTLPEHAHGYTFYAEAPGGFTVEVIS